MQRNNNLIKDEILELGRVLRIYDHIGYFGWGSYLIKNQMPIENSFDKGEVLGSIPRRPTKINLIIKIGERWTDTYYCY